MNLTVASSAGPRLIAAAAGEELAAVLRRAGLGLDTRCGGLGTCGRCRVRLVAGCCSVDGREVAAPAWVNACRARLLGGDAGIVVPAESFLPATGQIAFDLAILPQRTETVLAIDLGTTTVAAALIADGQLLASGGAFNLQNRYGDNIASRISGAAAALPQLRQAAIDTVRGILGSFPKEALARVSRVALAGNTVMSCLWHGIDPAPIGVLPFTPPLRVFPETTAEMLGLTVPLLTVPAISGYVGGDLAGGVGIVGLRPGELLVDIGTNCEIVLAGAERMWCAAAAAGPAFEGAGVRCGSRAVPGAIEHLWLEGGKPVFSTVGGLPPAGICGSAFIDFLAAGRAGGLLTEFGRLTEFESDGNCRFYRLAGEVVITEADIEQLLKAKAAVYAGIGSLLKHAGLELAAVKRIYLAGGFARYLNLDAAVAVGMLPALPQGEYRVVGNTALTAAARLAAEPEWLEELERLIDLPQEVPLNSIASFESDYIDALLLM